MILWIVLCVNNYLTMNFDVDKKVRRSVDDSVWHSVDAFVNDSVWSSVRRSVHHFVNDVVWHSVSASVNDSVQLSVCDKLDEYEF